ncbi:unnamed protein product, partial [Laminaria digitata]
VSSRLAPLGRKGHTATVACIRGQNRVLLFGGAPAGRRGLSGALYSVDLAKLSVGEGTWERHQPAGTAPAPRQGHSLTAVAGGKRLVLFGGVGEGGGILGDVQILETDGGCFSWASIQAPVGAIPTPRHGHSACEFSNTKEGCAAAGSTNLGGGVLVFGGEGRESSGPEVRPTDSHEAFLLDPQARADWAVETGHAFPIGRHRHSMALVKGWTPPSFHPDGTLTAAELALTPPPPTQATTAPEPHHSRGGNTTTTTTTSNNNNNNNFHHRAIPRSPQARQPTEAATFQWGDSDSVPPCALVFGGLNSMYVNPEVWLLPLRWREKTVQFSPPPPREPGGGGARTGGDERRRAYNNNNNTGGGGGWGGGGGVVAGLGFASSARLKGKVGAAAAAARGNVAAATSTAATTAATAAAAAAAAATAATAAPGGGAATSAAGRNNGGGIASAGFERTGAGAGGGGGGGAVWETGAPELGMREEGEGNGDGDGGVGALESTTELEAELIHLRKLNYVSEQKLSAEVSARIQLEEANKELQTELEGSRSSKEAAESQLREEANRRQWREGQRAKARCGNLERLLAEAYELINMAELRHVRPKISELL